MSPVNTLRTTAVMTRKSKQRRSITATLTIKLSPWLLKRSIEVVQTVKGGCDYCDCDETDSSDLVLVSRSDTKRTSSYETVDTDDEEYNEAVTLRGEDGG
jgi:hypothetical protein